MIFDKKKGMDLSKAFCHKCLLNIFCKTFHYTLVFKDASWPLVLTLIAKLIVFAFSDNLSAENSKSPAVSGNQRNQLLGCMDDNCWQCFEVSDMQIHRTNTQIQWVQKYNKWWNGSKPHQVVYIWKGCYKWYSYLSNIVIHNTNTHIHTAFRRSHHINRRLILVFEVSHFYYNSLLATPPPPPAPPPISLVFCIYVIDA